MNIYKNNTPYIPFLREKLGPQYLCYFVKYWGLKVPLWGI